LVYKPNPGIPNSRQIDTKMLKMSQPLTQAVIRTFVSSQILILLFASAPYFVLAKPPVPVLRLDAGNGIVAEFTDYGLTDYEVVNGQYRGNFCFTLSNTSLRDAPALPIYIVAMGLLNDNPGTRFQLSPTYVAPGNFVANGPIIPINDNIALDAFLGARNFLPLSKELIEGPTDGIRNGESLSFCLPLRSSLPFTLDDLITSFTVLFSDRVEACYLEERFPDTSTYAKIVVTSFGQQELGFQIENWGGASAEGEVITGAGFDVPSRADFSLLSINPSPQPGSQNFYFSTARRSLRLGPPE
jgi:hypothetical protein